MVGDAHLQSARNQHPKGGVDVILSKFHTSKNITNVHKIGGAHLQCVNIRYAKFEYKGTKPVGITDYTNQTPS